MKTMKWLLRREFWEHKGAFFWTPVVLAAAMLLLVAGGLVYAISTGHASEITVGGMHGSQHVMVTGLPPELRAKAADIATSNYILVAAPLFFVLPVVAFFYCLGALYDDRRDRSILFWKSLPVSDQMTVLSKVATALCVAPVITVAIGIATALVVLFLGALAAGSHGVNLVVPLLANPKLYLTPLYLAGLVPVYALWALPTVGWLLLVSSWARSKVFLWAVGTPLIALVLLKWFNYMLAQYSDTVIDVHWIAQNVVGRALGGLVPGVWLPFTVTDPNVLGNHEHGLDAASVFVHSWMSLGDTGVWIAAAAGVLMLFAAMRLRRWRDEG